MKKLMTLILAVTATLGGLTGCNKAAPNVVGLDLNDATRKLQEQGLAVGQVTGEFSGEDKKPGAVLRQDPAPETKLRSGTTVNLVVEQSVVMPNIVGRDQNAAIKLLQDKGFTVDRVESVFQNAKPSGTVLTQEPPANIRVATNTVVNLVIEYYVITPNFVGQSLEAAVELITQQGLTLGTVTPRKSTKGNPGTIMGQTQKFGAKVAAGTSIDLEIASDQAATGPVKLQDLIKDLLQSQLEKQANKSTGKTSKGSAPKTPKSPPRTNSTSTATAPGSSAPVAPPSKTPSGIKAQSLETAGDTRGGAKPPGNFRP